MRRPFLLGSKIDTVISHLRKARNKIRLTRPLVSGMKMTVVMNASTAKPAKKK